MSVNGTALTTSQFTVDSTLGVVNISTGYSTGVVIKAGFEFDVPVQVQHRHAFGQYGRLQGRRGPMPADRIEVDGYLMIRGLGA